MRIPEKAFVSVLQHAPLSTVERLPGVDLHIDDPAVKSESFIGVDGRTDVFVFDAARLTTNVALLENFDPGEDFLFFRNMDDRDLIAGGLGEGQGTHFVLFHTNGEVGHVVALGVPYEQETIEEMVLPFKGRLVYDDPFALG